MTLSISKDNNAVIVGTTASQTIVMKGGGPVSQFGGSDVPLNTLPRLLLSNEGPGVAYLVVASSSSGADPIVPAVVNSATTAAGQQSFALLPGAIMDFVVDKYYAYISMICDEPLTTVRCARMGGL